MFMFHVSFRVKVLIQYNGALSCGRTTNITKRRYAHFVDDYSERSSKSSSKKLQNQISQFILLIVGKQLEGNYC